MRSLIYQYMEPDVIPDVANHPIFLVDTMTIEGLLVMAWVLGVIVTIVGVLFISWLRR